MTRSEVNKYLNSTDVRIGIEAEFLVPAATKNERKMRTMLRFLEDMEWEYEIYQNVLESCRKYGVNTPTVPPWAAKLGYKKGDDIPNPKTFFELDGKEYFRNVAIQFRAEKLPFKYEVRPEYCKHDSKKWILKQDATLDTEGIEISSPILTMDDYMDICPKLFKHIDKHGKVNNQCGFHVSLSLKGIKDLADVIDPMKMAMFVDEKRIFKTFPSRRYNEFCESVHRDIAGKIKVGNLTVRNYKGKYFENHHHMGISLEHLGSRNEYIEFRYIGGTNYHRKWKEIKEFTAMFIKALKLSVTDECDDEYEERFIDFYRRRSKRYAIM